MKTAHSRPTTSEKLRLRAEQSLKTTRRDIAQMPVEDIQKLVHELQVHQIELEMQNDELQRAQRELEDARDRYANLYDLAPVGHLTLGANAEILEANLAAAQLLGRERGRLLHQKFTHFVAAEARDRFYLLCREVLKSDARQSVGLELVNVKAERLVILLDAVRSPSDPRSQFRISLTDITDRKQAEDALRDASQLNRQIIAGAKEGVIVYDRALKYLVWNPFMEQLTGLPADQVIGKHPLGLFPFLDNTGLMKQLEEALAGEECASMEFQFTVPETGRAGWSSGTCSPLRNAKGGITGVIRLVSDITERKRDELALRESEERFRQVTGAIEQVFWMTDVAKDQMLYISPAYERIWGRTCQSLYDSPRSWLEAVHPDDRPHLLEVVATKQATAEYNLEYRILRPDGSVHWIHDRAFPVLDGSGKVRRVVGVADDITERKHLEETLRRSERNLSDFFDQAPIGLVWLSARGKVLRANQAQLDLLGYSHPEYVGHLFRKSCAEPRGMRELLARLAARETIRNFRMPLRTKHGSVRQALVDANSFWSEGQFQYSSIFVRDITDRVRLESEILQISEQEHRRIAADLHDGLGQLLVGTAYLASTLQQDLAVKSRPEARRLGRISKVLQEAILQTRSLARGLRPVELEANGLMVALKNLAGRTRRLFGLECRFTCARPVLIEDNATATHLYRIAQEAITNAIKHGKPGRIVVSLTRTPERINLSVRDNGTGISAPHGRKSGMGLRIMRYRAGMIGGSLGIQKDRGGGTVVVCSVRLSRTGLKRLEPDTQKVK